MRVSSTLPLEEPRATRFADTPFAWLFTSAESVLDGGTFARVNAFVVGLGERLFGLGERL